MRADKIKWEAVRPSDGQWQEFKPSGPWALVWRRGDSDEKYYRLEFDGSLDVNGLVDREGYDMMKEVDLAENRYTARGIRLSIQRSNVWSVVWSGRFTGNHFRAMDECKCSVKLVPEVVDEYTCAIDGMDKEVNVATMLGRITVASAELSPWEFYAQRPPGGFPSGEGPGWALFWEDATVRVWRREFRITPCVGGVSYPPEGPDWSLVSADCAGTGLGKYARPGTATLSPQVEEGVCLSDGAGGTIAVPPPLPQTFEVTEGLHDAPVILGPTTIGNCSVLAGYDHDQTFKVITPRPGCSYEWNILLSPYDVTIIEGQGSPECVIRISMLPSNAQTNTFQLRVRESSACGTTAWSAIHVVEMRLRGYYAYYAVMPDFITAPAQCEIGGTFLATIPVRMGANDGAFVDYNGSVAVGRTFWRVTGPAVIVSSTETSASVKHTGGAGAINVSYRFGNGTANDAAWSTPRVTTPAIVPDVEAISGAATMCAGTFATFSVPAHQGSTYLWSAEPGLLIVGPSNATSVMVLCGPSFSGSANVILHETPSVSPRWVQVSGCDGVTPPLFWAISNTSTVFFEEARTLEFVINSAFGACGQVGSDFLQWSPSLPSGVNYVTGNASRVRNLVIVNKGDVKYPSATLPATKSITSLRLLLDMVKYLLNAYWFYDRSENRFRIEHASYFDQTEVVELTTECAKFNYSKEQLPMSEKWTCLEASNGDFIGVPVVYDMEGPVPRSKNASVGDKSADYTPGEVSTDLAFVRSGNDSEVSRKGFVILHCETVPNDEGDPVYEVGYDVGALTGMNMPNGHLSWANLHFAYHRYGRPVGAGYMNNVWTTFTGSNRNKVATNTVRMCGEELVNFDPYKKYQTSSGTGAVKEARLDFITDTLTISTEQAPS